MSSSSSAYASNSFTIQTTIPKVGTLLSSFVPRLTAVDPALVVAIEATGATVATRAIDRLASAHDASHYLLTPQAVVRPKDAREVAALFRASHNLQVPMTFRSGGTSLSGQAGTAGILADTRRHFRQIAVLDDGARVRTGPGATVRAVNARLSRHGRKLGPDPASEIACTVGGVIANNSSGMACGVIHNTYRTLVSATIVLPSGTIIDTAAADADELLRRAEPNLYNGLEQLRDRVRGNPEAVKTIRRLYSIKNTMGYSLNSFLDFDAPLGILLHLVVGSEGTLAFVADAVFDTVELKPYVATGLLLFADLAAATSALPALVAAGFATIELLDATSLKVAQRDPEATEELRGLPVGEHAALLVEYQESTERGLAARLAHASGVFEGLPLAAPVDLSVDAHRRAQLWHVRKGLYALVAGNRPSGTTALLEDIAVPVEQLYSTCDELMRLFDKYGYEDAVIFGHAKDGNIHFMLNENFEMPELLDRYAAFTEEMVNVVLSHDGTLKAEHGTGRIMAPYVRRQYGDELYEVMQIVKRLLDPSGLLNPGVLLNDDPQAHLRDLKTSPSVDQEVDRCVECGYCEPVCPSRDLTLTPRQRIVLRREMAHAEAVGDADLFAQLRENYAYEGVETCAVDGMCQTACPVLINTGDLVRRLRSETSNTAVDAGWTVAAKHWGAVSRVGGVAMSVAGVLPAIIPKAATVAARAVFGKETVPEYSAELPGGGNPRQVITSVDPVAVYFPSCTTTLFGPVGETGVSESFLALCDRAGVSVATPQDIPSLCCGTPWKSKGLISGYDHMKRLVAESLRVATGGGVIPVICDASSCTEGLRILLDAANEEGIEVQDAVEFADRVLLPALPASTKKVPSVTLHPTCSSIHLGLGDALARVSSAAADLVIVPDDWGCCAFAGDRGMLHSELTASATLQEALEAVAADTSVYASLNRTCELGMTRATGREYRHVLQLLDAATSGA